MHIISNPTHCTVPLPPVVRAVAANCRLVHRRPVLQAQGPHVRQLPAATTHKLGVRQAWYCMAVIVVPVV